MSETGQKVSIIMVDDDEDDCLIIKEALAESELDYNLTVFESGLELLDYLHGRGKYAGIQIKSPDLILLDLYMPEMSGMNVLKEIKEDPELRPLDIVVLTDSTEWSELSKCYQLGATAVFSKEQWLQTFADLIRISGPYWFKFVTFKVSNGSKPGSGRRPWR
jgi:CheY-like chemotaxis protein